MATDLQDVAAPEAPSDGISCLAWSPVQDMLAAGSWDQTVRLWEVGSEMNVESRLTMQHEAPVLSCCFMSDGQHLVTGSCDNTVRLKNLTTQQEQQVWQHEAPVKEVFSIGEMNLIVSGSWDKTLRFWSPQQAAPVTTIQLPERVYAMDVKYPMMVVGCADRHLLVFNLAAVQANPAPTKQGYTSLKMQTRSLSCFTDRSGYAAGSIEGRCSIVHLDDAAQTFTFRCHRTIEEYCAVNSLDFHPTQGTFATVGGDGIYTFWDKMNRQKLFQSSARQCPISAAKFSSQGTRFAYAVSYDWSRAHDAKELNQPNQVMVHRVDDKEVQARPKAAGDKKKT